MAIISPASIGMLNINTIINSTILMELLFDIFVSNKSIGSIFLFPFRFFILNNKGCVRICQIKR